MFHFHHLTKVLTFSSLFCCRDVSSANFLYFHHILSSVASISNLFFSNVFLLSLILAKTFFRTRLSTASLSPWNWFSSLPVIAILDSDDAAIKFTCLSIFSCSRSPIDLTAALCCRDSSSYWRLHAFDFGAFHICAVFSAITQLCGLNLLQA